MQLNEKLQSKLSQLHQRRKARETTLALPESLRAEIDMDRLTYKESVYAMHGLELFPKGVGGKYVYPEGYTFYDYFEVDQLGHLVSLIKNVQLVFDVECFVSLDNESGYWPLSHEKIDILLDWYMSYLEAGYQSLKIFQSDFGKGVVVDNYCGYLPNHLITNYDEVVYEFISWEKI